MKHASSPRLARGVEPLRVSGLAHLERRRHVHLDERQGERQMTLADCRPAGRVGADRGHDRQVTGACEEDRNLA